MAPPPSVGEIQVEAVTFEPFVKPPGRSTETLFLGGAGERGLEIGGEFVKFTAIGVYLGDKAVESLGGKWSGRSAEVLAGSVEFFRDIVTGGFEKFVRVTMLLPLTGAQYSQKVSENCVAQWKAAGVYTESEAEAIEEFQKAFEGRTFPPGSSILFTLSPQGSLTISFSKEDESAADGGEAMIENRLLGEAVLDSIIGKDGVSPAAKRSLAQRLAELLKPNNPTEIHSPAMPETQKKLP